MKTIAIPLLAAMLVAAPSVAERPQGEGQPGQEGPRRGRSFGDRERGGPPWHSEEVSDALRAEVEEFWKTTAPNRWEAYKTLDDPEKKKHVFGFMVGYYRGLGWLKQDEELFKARKAQIGIEDTIFAIQRKYKDVLGEDSADPRYAEARVALEKAAQELFDAQNQEKRLRIERLDKHVQQEKAELAADEVNKDKRVKEMLDRLMKGKPPVPMRGPDRDRNGRDKPERRGDKKDGDRKERE
jgi:hypothetical protein